MNTRRTNSSRRRHVAALLALCLLPSFAPDTFGLACPHHLEAHGGHGGDPGAEPVDGPAPVPGAAAGHGAASDGHGAAHPANMAPAGEHPAPHDAPPCTCAGQCTVSASPAAPGGGGHAAPVAAAPGRASALDTDGAHRLPAPPRYLLPPANGPPEPRAIRPAA